MATVDLSKENFDQTIQENSIVIVDFWADWYPPCKDFAAIFMTVSEKYSDIVFAKVDTEKEQELASSFQIRTIPFLMVFREQVIIFKYKALDDMQESKLESLVDRAKSLNMEQIKQRLNDEV